MENKKIATIIVITWGRLGILERMLKEIRKQKGYNGFEIIVANDGGEVTFGKQLKNSFPEVTFVDFPKHEGYVKLRSDLFKKAEAPFVFFLDDDSWFLEENAVLSASELFRKYPQAGILSFQVKLPQDFNNEKVVEKKPYEVAGFVGCAHAIRKVFFEGKNIYDGDYFRQGEERDLALMCLDNGHDILQVDSITVYHEKSAIKRRHQFIHGYAFRNELFFYVKYFPSMIAPFFMVKCLLSHGTFCYRKRWFRAYFFGLKRFFLDFSKFWQKRKPVSIATVKRYFYLKKCHRRKTW